MDIKIVQDEFQNQDSNVSRPHSKDSKYFWRVISPFVSVTTTGSFGDGRLMGKNVRAVQGSYSI